MRKPFAVSSDWHAHNWSAFNPELADGTTERMHLLANAIKQVDDHLLEHGGNTHIVTGDIFHVRGKIAPSVMNVLGDCLARGNKAGINYVMIPGNHDLESDYALDASSAVSFLRGSGVAVYSSLEIDAIGKKVYIPWIKDLAVLRKTLSDLVLDLDDAAEYDVFMHAPVNGVIDSMPDSGLAANELLVYGFNRIFSGHYHNHKVFENDTSKVISVGSLTHQSFRDVNSNSGYIYCMSSRSMSHHETDAPKFIDLEGNEPTTGNYVRIRVDGYTKQEQNDLHLEIMTKGEARGAVVHNTPSPTKAERSVTVSKSISLEQSVVGYCESSDDSDLVKKMALDVLVSAQDANIGTE